MRRFVLLAALTLLVATSAAAQDEPVPDTLDWRGYYPLEVGNVWEYEDDGIYGPESGLPHDARYERREITGDTLIDSTRYYVHRTRRYDADSQPVGEVLVDYLRYDTARTTVVAHAAGDSYPVEHWGAADTTEQPWAGPAPIYAGVATCDLSVDFESTHICKQGNKEWAVGNSGGYRIETYGDIISRARKSFGANASGVDYIFYHGIGQKIVSFEYLRIGDKEWGKSVVLDAEEPVSLSELQVHSAYPNPFRQKTTLTYRAPGVRTVIVTVFDALGRVLRQESSPALRTGTHHFTLDGRSLPAGLYVIRISDPSSSRQVTRRVVHLQ